MFYTLCICLFTDYYLNEKLMAHQSDSTDYLIPKPGGLGMIENPEYFEGDPRDSVFTSNVLPQQHSDPHPNARRSVNKPKIAPKPKRLTDYYNEIENNLSAPDNRRLLSNSSNCSNGESAV